MKIAIIGAGMAGLACAFELKKHEIIPEIFERNSYLGYNMNLQAISMRMNDNGYKDSFKYLEKKYNLQLNPICKFNKLIMNGTSEKTEVHANLGYIFNKGDQPYSLENQIYKQVNIPINFNSIVKIHELKKNYDFVIVATASGAIASELNCWNPIMNCNTRLVTLLGKFEMGRVDVWFNQKYSKNCFVFLCAENQKKAHLALIVNNISQYELDHYWKEFLKDHDLPYIISNTVDIENEIGFADQVVKENVIFTGNLSGMIDDFLGFGSFAAIASGIFAAQSIVKKKDYQELLKPIQNYKRDLHVLRELINNMENSDYDKLISLIDMPVIKQLIYNNPFFKLKYFSKIIKGISKN